MDLLESQDKQLIFYGDDDYTRRGIDYLVSRGIVPVCFVNNVFKKRFSPKNGEEGEILSLYEAIERYPNYELIILVNPRSYDAVRNKLIRNGIAPGRIKTLGAHSCRNIGHNFVLDGYGMGVCCVPNYGTQLYTTGNIKNDVTKYLRFCKELRDDLNSGKITRCTGCSYLEERLSSDDLQITRVNISSGLSGGDNCNAKCIYCTYAETVVKKPRQKSPVECIYKPENNEWDEKNLIRKALRAHRRGEIVLLWAAKRLLQKTMRMYNRRFNQKNNVLEIFRYFSEMSSVNYLLYTCGEITVSPYRNEILDYWISRNFQGMIFTNGFIYNEKIACLLEQGLINLNVSLDAGTKETFAKVKGVDCFSRVIDNLEKYAQTGGIVELKYILLHGVNTNEVDIDNFLKIAKKLNALVVISRDNRLAADNMNEEEYYMFLRIARGCREHGLKYTTLAEYLTTMDIQKLKSEIIL